MKKFLSTKLEIKNLTNDTVNIGGYLVNFGTVDFDGDTFSRETDFGFTGEITTPLYYDHGMDETVDLKSLGNAVIGKDDNGVWIDAQLTIRDEYEKAVLELAKKGKLGWSSGTATHLTRYHIQENGVRHWDKWPLGLDASLTPRPNDPTNFVAIKSYSGAIKMSEDITEVENIVEQDSDVDVLEQLRVQFEGKFNTLNQAIQGLTQRLESMPIKSKKTAVISQTGGSADKGIKSFGDFIVAVKRRDFQRIKSVYGEEYAIKDIEMGTGTSGGYLVPHQFANQLLQVSMQQSPILQKVTVVPVNGPSGEYPALDQTIVPTAGSGQTAEAAGVTAARRSEGGAYTEVTPSFTDLQWRVNDIGGYVEVTKEFNADSPFAVETLLRSLFSVAIGNKNVRNIIRGSGVGEPLGILNAACSVAVTTASDNVFAYADALNMLAHFFPVNPMSVSWIFHNSIWADLGVFETAQGGGVFQANMQAPFGKTLLGYELNQSQHSPQANNAGDVILADLSMYLLFMRQELYIDYSEHVGFLNGKDTWRFGQRNDGKPWLKGKITDASPQGSYELSPFVYHND